MARRERVYKPLTIKLSAISDPVARQVTEERFNKFNELRALATKAAREAALADAKANITAQEARMAFIELLLGAGMHLDAINTEQVWTVYRKDGELHFECPFTEVDQRNAMRVQRANVENAARQLGSPVESLYDGDEEEEEKPIGFAAGRD